MEPAGVGRGAGRARRPAIRGDRTRWLPPAPEDENEALLAALRKKQRTLPARLTGRERSKKLFDHLVRRGFPPGAVLEALRTKGDPVDDDE